MILIFLFFYSYGDHRDLHSFPTRPSSDLLHHLAIEERRPRFDRRQHRGPIDLHQQIVRQIGQEIEPHHAIQRIVVRRSEEHTSELQSHSDLVCRLLLEKKKKTNKKTTKST